ncbi:hypothetical protein Moror_13420 [Moniliophthora roreri MCA 2997]|uniref:DUF6699 domain-containing protein n=2 Tax=Moniliophthora roreri TaxID=221103 RepID=V2W5G1_MONRO|nr:hypothetical protein Moror_13420 [Moniliophthora roreri MCA 2997]KAI3609547.1 hypothetical protein WG66_001297 [Moniliophthora roreri]
MAHPLSGWTNPGRGLLDDGPPPLVDSGAPGVIPPPPGATFEGGGGSGLFSAFPGVGGGAAPPRTGPWTYGQYPHFSPHALPGALGHSQSMHTPAFYPNTPQTWAGAGSSPWVNIQQPPHRNELGFGSTAWHPPDLPPASGDPGRGWGGDAGRHSPWAEFGRHGFESELNGGGGGGTNWFQLTADRDHQRRVRSHSRTREGERGRSRQRSREGWRNEYDDIPDWRHRTRRGRGFEDDDDDDEEEEEMERMHEQDVLERFAPRREREGDLERRHRKHESVFPGIRKSNEETDWDMLDRFGGMGLGDAAHHRSAQIPEAVLPPLRRKSKHKRSKSRSRPRTLSLPSTPLHLPNPGIHVTYAQHLQRHNLLGPREEDLPYRPQTWRPDYTVKGGSFFGDLIRRGSFSAPEPYPFEDPVKRSLHPHLQFSTNDRAPPAISMDLRIVPNFPGTRVLPILGQMGHPVRFLSLGGVRELNQVDLMQYATNPPVQRMRLYHKRIPWYIEIQSVSGRAEHVKVWDVIVGLFDQLTGSGMSGVSQVRAEEYWAGEMGEHVSSTPSMPSVPLPGTPMMPSTPGKRSKRTAREQVSHSWRARGQLAALLTSARMISDGVHPDSDMVRHESERAEKSELGRGVRRVDWLSVGVSSSPGAGGFLNTGHGGSGFTQGGEEFRWIGLRRGRRGMWEVITEV